MTNDSKDDIYEKYKIAGIEFPFETFHHFLNLFWEIVRSESTSLERHYFGEEILTVLREAQALAITRSSFSKTDESKANLKSLMRGLNCGLIFAYIYFDETKNMDTTLRILDFIAEILDRSLAIPPIPPTHQSH